MSYTITEQKADLRKAKSYGDGLEIIIKQNMVIQQLLKDIKSKRFTAYLPPIEVDQTAPPPPEKRQK